jgi:endoglucanase
MSVLKHAHACARRLLVPGALALIVAGCGDATGPELDAPAGEARLSGPVVIESPAAGAVLSGTVRFRARVGGASPSQYRMVWLVDGGQQNAMAEVGGAEEATVDVSAWSWRGAGPYRVTFRAYDARGRRISEASVDVSVAQATPEPIPSGNPLAGARLYVDPYSNAKRTADAWRASRPTDAAHMDILAARPQADWIGDWSGDVRAAVDARVTTAIAAGALPVLVAYDIPVRDCSSYSAGGATSADAYRAWIRAFATGLEGRRTVVVLEPDALAGLGCLTSARQAERIALLADAVSVLAAGGALVYLDAGHARWQSAATMAQRLSAAGVMGAAGFALNVSNYIGSSESVAYGRAIRDLLGGRPGFLVDTSRNGLGPDPSGEWCNASGRALGTAPTTDPGLEGVDALLYLKRPGESDGSCNGGPPAGSWWAEYALGLAQRAAAPALVAARE